MKIRIHMIGFGLAAMLLLCSQSNVSFAADHLENDSVQPLVKDTVEMITVALETIQEDVKWNDVEEQKEMMLRIIGGYRDSVSPTLQSRNHISLARKTDQVFVKLDEAIQRQDKVQIIQQSQYAKELLKQIQDSF